MRVTADEAERTQLNDLFAELCRIESPSGHERACATRVIDELGALGIAVDEDGAAQAVEGDCGNLLARLPGRDGEGRPPLLLCAHLDTVPLDAPVEPVVVDGGWENANEAILGADNKAAVAVILMAVRRAVRDGLPLDLELLFTVGEEQALAGARAFDASRLTSKEGYVFDHASPIGEVIVASPTHYRLEATFHGAAAHAGIRPEQGRSAIAAAARAICAMQLGRLDEETTANVGTITGGTAMNVVPERCTVVAEARSLDDSRAEAVVAEMVDHIHDAANLPASECDVDVSVQRLFAGYRALPTSASLVAAAERALDQCGYRPRQVVSGGASDANALRVRGVQLLNLANGTERNHEPGERVAVAALEGMLDVALTLLWGGAA